MTSSASAPAFGETILPGAPSGSGARKRRTAMFGHRPVGWGRHAGAIFGAAFVSSTAQVLIGVLLALSAMSITGKAMTHPIAVVATAAGLLWMGLFLVALAQLTLFLTVARLVLMAARRNFGAAYLALGLVIGMVEAKVVGAMSSGASTSPRHLVVPAAIGVAAGFVYWLIAARDRDQVAIDERTETASLFR